MASAGTLVLSNFTGTRRPEVASPGAGVRTLAFGPGFPVGALGLRRPFWAQFPPVSNDETQDQYLLPGAPGGVHVRERSP